MLKSLTLTLGLLMATGAAAEGLKDRPRPRAFDPIETSFQASAYGYAGLLAGWGRAEMSGDLLGPFSDANDAGFVWGGFLGYMVRPSQVFAFGVEVDYVRTNFEKTIVVPAFGFEALKSDWNASGRLRAGVYPITGVSVMIYVTGGVAWSDRGDGVGGVYGAGIEADMTKNIALRLELLQYNFDGTAGDQTIGRLGVAFKLQ